MVSVAGDTFGGRGIGTTTVESQTAQSVVSQSAANAAEILTRSSQ